MPGHAEVYLGQWPTVTQTPVAQRNRCLHLWYFDAKSPGSFVSFLASLTRTNNIIGMGVTSSVRPSEKQVVSETVGLILRKCSCILQTFSYLFIHLYVYLSLVWSGLVSGLVWSCLWSCLVFDLVFDLVLSLVLI